MKQISPTTGERIIALIITLVLARHGKAPKISPTQKDEDRTLNELGFEQAKKLAAKIGDTEFDSVLCSPLLRAHETIMIAVNSRTKIKTVPELTCPTDGVHPIDRMFNQLGYKPLSDYFAHELGDHLKTWGRTALEKVLDALGEKPSQTVLVGGHAILQNALGWAICEALTEAKADAEKARAMVLTVSLGEGEAFKLTPPIAPSEGEATCEHIKLD